MKVKPKSNSIKYWIRNKTSVQKSVFRSQTRAPWWSVQNNKKENQFSTLEKISGIWQLKNGQTVTKYFWYRKELRNFWTRYEKSHVIQIWTWGLWNPGNPTPLYKFFLSSERSCAIFRTTTKSSYFNPTQGWNSECKSNPIRLCKFPRIQWKSIWQVKIFQFPLEFLCNSL